MSRGVRWSHWGIVWNENTGCKDIYSQSNSGSRYHWTLNRSTLAWPSLFLLIPEGPTWIRWWRGQTSCRYLVLFSKLTLTLSHPFLPTREALKILSRGQAHEARVWMKAMDKCLYSKLGLSQKLPGNSLRNKDPSWVWIMFQAQCLRCTQHTRAKSRAQFLYSCDRSKPSLDLDSWQVSVRVQSWPVWFLEHKLNRLICLNTCVRNCSGRIWRWELLGGGVSLSMSFMISKGHAIPC